MRFNTTVYFGEIYNDQSRISLDIDRDIVCVFPQNVYWHSLKLVGFSYTICGLCLTRDTSAVNHGDQLEISLTAQQLPLTKIYFKVPSVKCHSFWPRRNVYSYQGIWYRTNSCKAHLRMCGVLKICNMGHDMDPFGTTFCEYIGCYMINTPTTTDFLSSIHTSLPEIQVDGAPGAQSSHWSLNSLGPSDAYMRQETNNHWFR